MFNFFRKKKRNKSEFNELKELVLTFNKFRGYIGSGKQLSSIPLFEDIKNRPEKEQKDIILKCIDLRIELILNRRKFWDRHKYDDNDINYFGPSIIMSIISGMIRKKLNYTEEEWIELFTYYKKSIDVISKKNNYNFPLTHFPVAHSIKQIEYHLKKNEGSSKLNDFIKEMLEWKALKNASINKLYGGDNYKIVTKLKKLMQKKGETISFQLKTNDIGDAVNQVINTIDKNKTLYDQIFTLASKASSGKPSQKFIKEVKKLQDEIGPDIYRKIAHELLKTILDVVPTSTTTTEVHGGQTYQYINSVFLCIPSQQFIKGVVWTMVRYADKETILILSKISEKAYTKIPGKGPSAASVGNAAVYVLGNMRGKDGLGALSRLKLKVRQNNVKKTIDKHLVEGAKKYNVSVEELKEMAVPNFHLENGRKRIQFDDYWLDVFIEGKKVNQQWVKPDGTPMKSVPSVVKNSQSLTKKLAACRKEVKEIQKVYSAQKQRIDNQFILARSWDFISFKKYYLNHGLVFPIIEKLIWTFTNNDKTANAILLDNNWYTIAHDLIDWIDNSTTVELWHPINADEKTIIDWREKMMDLEWRQPIKQAYREIYVLTDAEVTTRTYSNRMAAHILKQHQFNALANLRNWKYALMGAYDDGRDSEVCKKYLPEYKITAEYWIDEVNQDDSYNDVGIWFYIATDQVKFKDESNQVMEMTQVPKMVFTEIMRDVDMFVGVCSVGNDPQWMDNNGARQANRDYWTSYSFGDLTEIAKTRKSILERLLPRLKKIRDKAHIEGKFLIVKGDIRTYKIHIGSGNILMEPNDQYLCIVPARSAEKSTDRIFIPFEGDKGLSIVLSKAFLLAEDRKITDSTIISQIGR